MYIRETWLKEKEKEKLKKQYAIAEWEKSLTSS
jgi:hypothetical protein